MFLNAHKHDNILPLFLNFDYSSPQVIVHIGQNKQHRLVFKIMRVSAPSLKIQLKPYKAHQDSAAE